MRFALAVAVVALTGAGAAVWAGDGNDPPAYVAEHPVAVPETARTVTVSRTMPLPSVAARSLSARLVAGELRGPTGAEVLTDTDCTPDARMISRCRNELLLDDGSRIVLRHPHDMTKVPCLAPGERVQLVPSGL